MDNAPSSGWSFARTFVGTASTTTGMQARPATNFLIENAYLRAPPLDMLLWKRNAFFVKLNRAYPIRVKASVALS
jgi:hypothetical protein